MDITTHRLDGATCTASHGNEILWNGHLCEGANLTPSRSDNFCLWTRCGKHDVPAGRGYEGSVKTVTCAECLKIWNEENSQFGAGA